MKKITQQFKITFYFFVFSLGLIITFIFIDINFFSNQLQKTAMSKALDTIKEKEHSLSYYFDKSEKILYSLNSSNYFNKYLENKLLYKNEVDELFTTVSQINKNIMQLRFLDAKGYEKIRIDRKNTNSDVIVVSEKNLQNKSNRYYFKESLDKKNANKVWFSNLDLNMENNKVVKPYVPTLRAIFPVFRNDKFQGIIIINYFMDEVIKELNKTALYDVILLNDKGEVLTHFNRNKSWSSYKNKKSILIEEFPSLYDNIIKSNLYISNSFISKKLAFKTPNKLIYMVQFKKEYLLKNKEEKFNQYIIISSIIVLLSLFMSYIFSKYFKRIFFLLRDSENLNKVLGSEVDEKTKQLEELNANLEIRIKEEIQKNKEKDEKLFAQAKHVAMAEMLGNIAHQWRQPLSLISTNASGVKLRYLYDQLDSKELPSQMDVIIDKTLYLSNTIESFSSFLLEDKEHSNLVLQDSVNNAIQIVSGSLESNYIKLHNEIDTNRPISLFTIASDLTEVLINILTNAKDALLHRSINDAMIIVGIEVYEDLVSIIIEDNAGGIESHNINRVFEPYFTTKHKAQGTGLGLHMSYKIVTENLNGNLLVENSSLGAKFKIDLPLNK